MEMFEAIRQSLESVGLWAILMLTLVKTVTGIAVAVQQGEFKLFLIGNVLKNDLLKVAVLGVLAYTYSEPTLVNGVGAVLLADLFAGVAKNVNEIFPNVTLPNMLTARKPEVVEIKGTIVEK